jgi:hypothetical protein
MSLRRHGIEKAWLVALILFASVAGLSRAQQSGHYLQGIAGLDNGTVAPPGVYVSFVPWVNTIRSYRGTQGQKLEDLGLNVAAHNLVFQETAKQRLLGADYAVEAIFPVVNSRVVAATSAGAAPQPGISDLYVSPLILGWSKGRAHYLVSYGFYAPTGDFDPTKSQNAGLGFWEQQIQGGISYSFDKQGLWNASALSTWEINQSKNALDLKPGPMVNVEYSLGHRFDGHKINFGAAGYDYQKLSSDSGTDAVRLGSLARDRSFGFGPEFKFANPAKHFAFDLRYEHQFGVESKTQGDVFVAGVTWVNVFSPRHR